MRSLQDALQYSFRDEALLRLALTHPSTKEARDNQRLEFLGDSVLEFVVSDILFHKYPERQEGELTARRASLVCEETLCFLARELSLGPYLHMGHGEESTSGREKPSILADAMEAVIAAVYLDGGIRAAYALIERLFRDEEKLSALRGRDDKSLLQEYTQAHELGLPEYTVVEESGPAHMRHFVTEARIRGQAVARGTGASKKAAEQSAARQALDLLNTKG
ncbi:MAG TPA: ribonuclease III [Candidatus Limiplasma sp.]|nr:ribonuclease III [Candidatus Limiplasma sp.]HPS81567.1 ribonuclease III [Candidatus Limiplasma sp.]